METTQQIYDAEETAMFEEVKDETLRAKLDEFCERFTKAKSLFEIRIIHDQAIQYLISATTETNKSEIKTIAKIVTTFSYRTAINITVSNILSQNKAGKPEDRETAKD